MMIDTLETLFRANALVSLFGIKNCSEIFSVNRLNLLIHNMFHKIFHVVKANILNFPSNLVGLFCSHGLSLKNYHGK